MGKQYIFGKQKKKINMNKKPIIAATIFLMFVLISTNLYACTNFLITRGASVNGATMITYAADAHVLYGELYHWPAMNYPEGAMLDIYEWDTGKFLGKIRQVRHTFSVVGNMNEKQVAIGETTYGGRPGLHDPEGIMDYGSLMFVTLQRASSAREAIKIMGELVAEYGYCSSGESFSISDKNEVWIMELIGKGPGNKGAVWVARRIPDGYVSAHANQARITTFPLNNPENCLFAEDVISFAREKGWFDGKDKNFSFSDTYAPVDFGGARFCEARVWSFFNRIATGMDQYLDYAMGENLDNRMPLWIKPDQKISVQDVMHFMRDHFENTPLDMTKDFGAGPFELPYRWRPLTWKANGETYCNERATATQQTGFSFVTESRNWLPDWIGGIFWFGVDDAATSVYVPMYCGISEIPENYAVGNGDMLTYSPTSAFWLFNTVSNFCYLRYNDMSADVRKHQASLENKFITNKTEVDKKAVATYNENPENARQILTEYSLMMASTTFQEWKKLSEFLLVKYIDGNIKKEENGEFLRDEHGRTLHPDQPGYPDWWYEKVAGDTREHLKVKSEE
jgi:dipeptidase